MTAMDGDLFESETARASADAEEDNVVDVLRCPRGESPREAVLRMLLLCP